MYATPTQKTLSLLTLLLLFAVPANADHFTAREDQTTGQERGVVVSHGMDLFILTRSAGGVSPARRAEIIADRLQQLTEAPNAPAENFRVGYRNGEVALLQQEADHPTRTIVTVDPQLTSSGKATRLAKWWLALLRDHISLAMGRRPKYTEGTRVGAIFQKIYSELGEPTEPVPSDAIDHAVQTLSPEDQSLFAKAATQLPAGFLPEAGNAPTMPPEAGDDTAKNNNADGDTPPKDERNNPDTATDATKPPADSPRTTTGDPAQPQDNAGPAKQNDDSGRRRDADKPNADNTRVHDAYKVVLVTDPATLVPGKRVDIAIRLISSSPDDSPVGGADLRAWMARAAEKPTKSLASNYDADTDLYHFSATLPRSGDCEFQVGVLTESGDVFKVAFPLSLAEMQDDLANNTSRPAANGSRTRHIGAFAVTMTTDPRHPTANQDSQIELKIRDEDAQAWVTKATVRIWLLADGQEATDVKPITAESAEEPGIYFCQIPGVDVGKYRLLVRIETTTGRVLRVTFPLSVGPPEQGDNGNPANPNTGNATPEDTSKPPVPETALPI